MPGRAGIPRSAMTPLTALRLVDPGRYMIYLAFLLILAVFSGVLRNDGFLTAENLLNIAQETTPVTIMAIGMVFVLTLGEIDLSIGSVVALSALVSAVMLRRYGMIPGVLAGLGTGAVIGLVNGLFVTRLRLASFLVTLAMLGLVAGLARSLTELQSVPVTDVWFIEIFGSGGLGPVPALVIWSGAALAIGHFVYRRTRFGAHVRAIGDNRTAALVAGIKVDRMRVAVLVISATSAALAGLLYAGRLQGARYSLGEADLMTVIAAVIIGGTRLTGGAGSVPGALVGSLLMGMLNNGLILMGLSVSEQVIARGCLILLAVALSPRSRPA
jgi:ribose transport system permease protein